MKKPLRFLLTFLFGTIIFSSCKQNDDYLYKYNYSPVFSWGYAEFFGQYYSHYDIDKNVLSLSLFTDSLSVDDEGNLAGYGQYLYFEDIFISSENILLPDGVYHNSDNYEEFTFTPGSKYKVDSLSYTIGAYILFVEKESARSVLRYIKEGTITISSTENSQSIDCHLILDNDSVVNSQFNSSLNYYNESGYNFISNVRKRKVNVLGFLN